MITFNPRPLIFIHLPKAAGSTLQEIVVRQYQGGRSFVFTGDPAQHSEFLSLPPEERAAFDVLLGHVQFGLHEHLPDPATYITMLRDPIDRVVSHYHFILARPEHYLHDSLRSSGYSLGEWVQKTPIVLDNYQLRWLISRPLADIPSGGVTREMLEEAKWNLQNAIQIVGLMERFDDSVACLASAFGWRDVKATEQLNRNLERPAIEQIEPEAIAAIRRLNRFDIELYQFASSLFEAQCRRLQVGTHPPTPSSEETVMAAWKDEE